MEGYLKKWINLIFQWQSRYFIIHEGVLIYCLQKDKPKKGQVHLSICSIRLVPSDPLRIVINYGMSEMHLRASSVQEKQKWYEALINQQDTTTTLQRRYSLLNPTSENPFATLPGAPRLNLNRIHTTLTKIWVAQAQLQERLSTIRGPESAQLQAMSTDLKELVTACAQQVDEEYKKLIAVQQKLEDRIRENNDHNPPDHPDDLDDEMQEEHCTLFESFNDEDEFHSVNQEVLYDVRTPILQPQRKMSLRQEASYQPQLSSRQQNIVRQASFQPEGSKSIQEILDRLKAKQPIKYRNMFQCDAFKDMNLGVEDQRALLPCFKDPNEKIRLFSVIKDMAGKDMTKITFPVTFNEPLSMLQNFCENLEYARLLDDANRQQDSCLRMAYVMAFAVSSYSSTINRVKKPFNPILGETFEFTSPGFRYVSEQISHHPPISVGHAENANFEYWGDSNLTTQFWGKSITVTPMSFLFVKLKQNNDFIHFQRAKSALKNLIIGQQYLENYGQITFQNRTTGDVGQLNLTERGWNGGGAYQLKGWVKDKMGAMRYTLQGQWDSTVTATSAQTKQEIPLWTRNKLPPQHEQQYFFTQFALNLNHLSQQIMHQIPPTDSRLRPDQRALENGNIEIAAIEKTRLEQKQRQRRTELKNAQKEHQAVWFHEEVDNMTNTKVYIFNGTYWDEREKPTFHTNAFDIF